MGAPLNTFWVLKEHKKEAYVGIGMRHGRMDVGMYCRFPHDAPLPEEVVRFDDEASAMRFARLYPGTCVLCIPWMLER